ncbi:MAG: hypothetical protein Q4A59_03650 [Erysipelotrichaceae bacterium]|nr:hypothetical protein [Erysipelotrichaceae bacterium]
MNYSLRMKVVVSSEDETQGLAIQNELKNICAKLSFSPMRLEPSLEGCLEFAASAVVDEHERTLLVDTLDNDWDYDDQDDLYWAYGFNTTLFDKRVYYLELEFSKIKK